MSLLQLVLIGLAEFAAVGVDIMCFFVVMRLLSSYWPKDFVIRFDRVGSPLVDPFIDAVTRVAQLERIRDIQRRLRFAAALTLLILALGRLGLNALMEMPLVTIRQTAVDTVSGRGSFSFPTQYSKTQNPRIPHDQVGPERGIPALAGSLGPAGRGVENEQ